MDLFSQDEEKMALLRKAIQRQTEILVQVRDALISFQGLSFRKTLNTPNIKVSLLISVRIILFSLPTEAKSQASVF